MAALADAPLVELLEEVRPLARELAVVLVRQELAGLATSLNGASFSSPALATKTAVSGPENAHEPRRRPGLTPKPAQAARVCNRCGEAKPPGEYAKGRGTCRSCRRAQQREHDRRMALAEDEEPHPAPSPQQGRKSQRRLDSDRYWNERRRQLIEQARVTTEERDGRKYVVRHLAPQFGAVFE